MGQAQDYIVRWAYFLTPIIHEQGFPFHVSQLTIVSEEWAQAQKNSHVGP